MTIRRRAGLYFRFRAPEQLELRNMLSGHAFTAGFSHFGGAAERLASYQSVAESMIAQATARNHVFAALGSFSSYSEHTSLTASLTDTNGSATGTVTYKTGIYDGASETELTVSVTGATPNGSLDVVVGGTSGTGGTVVGKVATDSTGAGTAVFSTNPTGTEQAFTTVPTDVTAGTAVNVDTLSGTLAASTHTGGGCESSQHSVVAAALTDTNGSGTGTATYKTFTKHGVTTTTFTVSVAGAAASRMLDVVLDGTTTVGQISTDATGAGTLVLSSNPTGSQVQLPANFPAIIAGTTTITVDTLNGTFATSTNSSQFHHFRHR